MYYFLFKSSSEKWNASANLENNQSTGTKLSGELPSFPANALYSKTPSFLTFSVFSIEVGKTLAGTRANSAVAMLYLLVLDMSKNPHIPFENVYKKLALPLTKFIIKHMGGNEETVDEVLSETMTAAWKGWKTFKHKSSYFTWLCRIALNKIADYYRDQVNRNSRIIVPLLGNLNIPDDKSLSPEEKISLQELRESVNNCLNLLPYDKRRLLWFRYWQDLSYQEIAKILGISERAVEGRLYRAKEAFRKLNSDINFN